MSASTQTILHIGMPKTGTTTLQKRLYAHHSDVCYLGKFYPPQDYFLNEGIERMICAIRDGWVADKLAEQSRQQVAAILGETDRNALIWSDEEATLTSRVRLQQRAIDYQKIFGDCKILLTMRNALPYVQSLHRHLVTTYQVDRSRKLMSKQLKRSYWEKPRFLSMAQWLETLGYTPDQPDKYGVDNLIDVNAIAEIFADVFGSDNVAIFLFEHMVEDFDDYVSELSQFLNIDANESLKLLSGHRDASATSLATVANMQKICESSWRTLLFQSAPQSLRNRMAGIPAVSEKTPTTLPVELEVPENWQQRINETASLSNQQLVKNWNLPLEQYGYSL